MPAAVGRRPRHHGLPLFLRDRVFCHQKRGHADAVLGAFVVVAVARPRPHHKPAGGQADHFQGHAVPQVFDELPRAVGAAVRDLSLPVDGHDLKLELFCKWFLFNVHRGLVRGGVTPLAVCVQSPSSYAHQGSSDPGSLWQKSPENGKNDTSDGDLAVPCEQMTSKGFAPTCTSQSPIAC